VGMWPPGYAREFPASQGKAVGVTAAVLRQVGGTRAARKGRTARPPVKGGGREGLFRTGLSTIRPLTVKKADAAMTLLVSHPSL